MSESLLNHASLHPELENLADAPHWYVGLSGGADSTVLLHLMHAWCAQHAAPPMTAIHINHGMQVEADDWQQHCQRLCAELDIPLISRIVQVSASGGPEAAARSARYRVFEELLPAHAVLFLGHHLDDQVETFFLRLMRGAGVAGLAAMPRRRALGRGLLVRPLLNFRRSEIEQYARRCSLNFVTDPSNDDTAMDRNFLRADVLPLLASRWPSYAQTVVRTADHMADTAALLDDNLGVPPTRRTVMGDVGLAVADLLEQPEAAAAVRLRAWLHTWACQAPTQMALEEFLRQLRAASADGNPRLTCTGYSLQRYNDTVCLLPDFPREPPLASYSLVVGDTLEIPGVGDFGLQPASGAGLSLAPVDQLKVIWRQGGERCRLPDRSGSRSLKKLLQEWAVPPWWRDRVPLLYLDDELLAVGDLAQCVSSRLRSAVSAGEQLWEVSWQRPESRSCD